MTRKNLIDADNNAGIHCQPVAAVTIRPLDSMLQRCASYSNQCLRTTPCKQLHDGSAVTIETAAAAATVAIALLDIAVEAGGQVGPVLPKRLSTVHSIRIILLL